VTQRIEVRVRDAVRCNGEIVLRRAHARLVRDVARADHGVHGRAGVVAIADGIDRVRATHADAVADEPGSADALLGADQIQGAAFVVAAPAAPVAAALEEGLEIRLESHRRPRYTLETRVWRCY
jgi:hypothetical protein